LEQSIQPNHSWYALHVQATKEKHVATVLRDKGYTEFVPLYRARRRWSDRFQEVELALFPGYLFCRFDPQVRLPILTTPWVRGVVGAGKTPIPVAGPEVEAIQAVVHSGLGALPWPFLQEGDRVLLAEGPLAGLEGLLVDVRNESRLVVSVSLLQRSVAVEIERAWLRPV
jgi:transcription antitermination factor NusG